MAKAVKRAYVSRTRDEQAQTTRWSIVQAATRLFATNGYAATTIQAIADDAGVAVQTVYAVFGNKRRLLDEVIEAAIVGDDDPTPVTDRPEVLAFAAESDPRRRAQMSAAYSRRISERVAPIIRVAREAAASDPGYASVYDAMRARRRSEMIDAAKTLAGPGTLRIRTQDAAATLYVLYSPDVADMLMGDYGWSADRYERWLADALERMLLS